MDKWSEPFIDATEMQKLSSSLNKPQATEQETKTAKNRANEPVEKLRRYDKG